VNGPEAATDLKLRCRALRNAGGFESAICFALGSYSKRHIQYECANWQRLLMPALRNGLPRACGGPGVDDTRYIAFKGLLLRFQTAYALFDTRPADHK